MRALGLILAEAMLAEAKYRLEGEGPQSTLEQRKLKKYKKGGFCDGILQPHDLIGEDRTEGQAIRQ